jgi:hypothetical protein
MIVTLLIASLAVVLRTIRQAGWKKRDKPARAPWGYIFRARLFVRSGITPRPTCRTKDR